MSGPTPKYQPTFTTEQLEEAQHLAVCYQAPHVQVQRAKMALTLTEHPDIATPELGRQIDAHPNTVFKWRKDWTIHGFHLEDHPRSGRPLIFSPDADRRYQSHRLRVALQTQVAVQSAQSI
jgi:hypothetical protein